LLLTPYVLGKTIAISHYPFVDACTIATDCCDRKIGSINDVLSISVLEYHPLIALHSEKGAAISALPFSLHLNSFHEMDAAQNKAFFSVKIVGRSVKIW
jgi:hypothetical protein